MKKHTKSPKAPKPVLPSVRLYRRIAGVFLCLTVVLLVVVLYVATVQATVRVTTQAGVLERSFEARVMVEPQGAEDVPGIVFSQVYETTKTIEVSGEGETVPAKAFGTVVLVNESSRAQPLIATTRLLNQDNVLFRLKEGVTVPANGEVEAKVEADLPGIGGEIAPSRFTIPGLNETRQREVYATSLSPMVGGEVTTSVLTQSEIDAAVEEMVEAAKTEADTMWRERISGQLDGAELLVGDVSWSTDAEVGSEVSLFDVDLAVELTGIYYDRTRLAKVAEVYVSDYVPDGRVLMDIAPDQLTVTYNRHSAENGTAHFDVDVKADVVLERTADVLDKDNLVGLTAEEAERFLELQETIQDAQVILEPFWVRRIPRLRDHITIEVVE